jgi:hypothetical protein
VSGPRPAAGWRRLAAGGADYGVVAVHIALLALVGALGRAAGLLPARIATPGGRRLDRLGSAGAVAEQDDAGAERSSLRQAQA